MKLVIVTNGNFFARVIVERLIRERAADIAGIVVIVGVMAGKSRLASFWRVLKQSGLRHFMYKGQTYLVFLLAGLLWPRRAYFVPQLAARYDIPVMYANQVKADEVYERIREWGPDILISVSCPQRIPARVLNLPTRKAINIHSSLLPAYAGISPYIWVLANGETRTGTTVHVMEEDFDTGEIVVQKTTDIRPRESVFGLFYRLSKLGEEALGEAVAALAADNASLTPQDASQRSYYTWPGAADIRRMARNKHPLARWGDFWRAIKETR